MRRQGTVLCLLKLNERAGGDREPSPVSSGILIINKEKGFTSNDVVSLLRGVLKMKKIGHTGTLDPEAEGVLPVCLGKATRLVSLLTDSVKEYSAGAVFGFMTDTEDMTGKVLLERQIQKEERPEESEIRKVLSSFEGGYEQIPPMYSAKKVNGKKLYELAREGIEIERKPSFVKINGIRLTGYSFPRITLEVSCGKGTYIRSLIRDAGEKLKLPLCMDSLVRTASSGFTLSDALTLDEVKKAVSEGKIGEHIKSIESFFSDLPNIRVSGKDSAMLKNGNTLRISSPHGDGDHRLYTEENEFAAVYTVTGNTAKLKRMFL